MAFVSITWMGCWNPAATSTGCAPRWTLAAPTSRASHAFPSTWRRSSRRRSREPSWLWWRNSPSTARTWTPSIPMPPAMTAPCSSRHLRGCGRQPPPMNPSWQRSNMHCSTSGATQMPTWRARGCRSCCVFSSSPGPRPRRGWRTRRCTSALLSRRATRWVAIRRCRWTGPPSGCMNGCVRGWSAIRGRSTPPIRTTRSAAPTYAPGSTG